jgi:hypothetical protein
MNNLTKQKRLLPLVAQLGCCTARDGIAIREAVSEAWEVLRRESFSPMSKPSSAVMAAVVINSKLIGRLLTNAERVDLLKLADLALERYEQQTNPPNKLGNLIASIVREL